MRFLPKFVLLLLVLAALAGCSGARLAYNNADTLVRWMADDYFALEGPQLTRHTPWPRPFPDWSRSGAHESHIGLGLQIQGGKAC